MSFGREARERHSGAKPTEDAGKFSSSARPTACSATTDKRRSSQMGFCPCYAARAGRPRSQGLPTMIRLHPEEGIRVHVEGGRVPWLRCVEAVITTGLEKAAHVHEVRLFRTWGHRALSAPCRGFLPDKRVARQ